MHEQRGFGTYRLNSKNAYDSTLYALQTGYKWIDTAPLYKNMIHVGNAIVDSGVNRAQFKITSKISRDTLINGDMKTTFYKILTDLKCDYIDELILHEPIDPIINWRRLVDLYNETGLIKQIGVSNFNIASLQAIIDDTQIIPCVNQIEVNPFILRSELIEYMNNMHIGVVAHSPLAKGEKLDNKQLIEISHNLNISPAQLMLQWGVQKGYRVIPRSCNKAHIDENNKSVIIDDDTMNILSSLNCNYATHPKYL